MKIIIIDGRSGAGKTTYANSISKNVVHMDDFFLPIELRTQDRLCETGGNIHYERFKEEVIDPIKNCLLQKRRSIMDEAKENTDFFKYRIFNCKEMKYIGERTIKTTEDIVIEGAYSMHPYFDWDALCEEFQSNNEKASCSDSQETRDVDSELTITKIFMDISKEEQEARIIARNGQTVWEIFREKWIPMEEEYIKKYLQSFSR